MKLFETPDDLNRSLIELLKRDLFCVLEHSLANLAVSILGPSPVLPNVMIKFVNITQLTSNCYQRQASDVSEGQKYCVGWQFL